ncbi:MAG: hypothetical protein HYY05_04440 [Chloroflexi bacterium]|nr:hypothetical protein [Chloroflexota bacterium]
MKKVTVVFEDEFLYRALKVRAAADGRTLREVISEAMERWLEQQEDREDAILAEAAMREPGESIPWELVKTEQPMATA